MLLVGEADEAHGGLAGAAALPRPGDGVAHAAVRQPARVAAVVAQQLPGGEDLPHLGDLGPVLQARLHGLVVGQLGGVDQVVEATWREEEGRKEESLAARRLGSVILEVFPNLKSCDSMTSMVLPKDFYFLCAFHIFTAL